MGAQYMLQAGVDLDTEIFIDKRQNPTGHSYTSNGAVSTLYEFRDRWRDDSTLQAESTPSAKVIYELDKEFVDKKGGESAAVEEANAMTNLATAQYMLQAGVDLDTEIFIDKRQNPGALLGPALVRTR